MVLLMGAAPLNEQAGPAADSDSSSAMWLYRSLVEQQAHANAGLFGPLIITRAGAADPATAKPKDIDAEFVTILQASPAFDAVDAKL